MKITTTFGMIRGEPIVLLPPSTNPEEHVKFLRDLTDAKGIITTGKGKDKNAVQVEEAEIYHTVKGILKRRRFGV